MDETGFAIGSTQSNRIIVDSTQKVHWKSSPGRQEWVTVIECIDACGGDMDPEMESIPPMIIFKAKNTNSSWIPENTPPEWQFSTSKNGWTSNNHGFEWFQKVFEPQARKRAGKDPILLIMDGHGSHVTGKLIAACITKDIDLLIMPPHCSHVLQPLDVGVFSPLKKFHGQEVDRYSRQSISRITRNFWVDIYI